MCISEIDTLTQTLEYLMGLGRVTFFSKRPMRVNMSSL